jgi:hypothetical protein
VTVISRRKCGAPVRGRVIDLEVKAAHPVVPGITRRAGWDRHARQSVQPGHVPAADLQPFHVFAAHGERPRVDEDERTTKFPRIRDYLRRAAAAPRWFAVPDRNEQVAVVHGFHATIEVSIYAATPFADDPDMLRFRQQRLDLPPLGVGKIVAEFRGRQRQDRFPTQLLGERGPREKGVAPGCDRRQRQPLDTGRGPQLDEDGPQHAPDARGSATRRCPVNPIT